MQAIELETSISNDGKLQIPIAYQQYYGKKTKIVVLLPDMPVDRPDVCRDIKMLHGILPAPSKAVTLEEMDAAIKTRHQRK
ncbi:MAG: hypothetical protein PHP00_01425 [Thiotrichaceae bacterium]|nr:hypothetical protein [Thiotrichaceae bacterium]